MTSPRSGINDAPLCGACQVMAAQPPSSKASAEVIERSGSCAAGAVIKALAESFVMRRQARSFVIEQPPEI
jgi:hypothetical protein